MRKSLLTLLAVLLSATAVHAQIEKWQGKDLWEKSPAHVLTIPNKAKQKVQKAELAENQRVMGFYTGDELASSDYSIGLMTNGTFKAGVLFTPDLIGNFTGGKIVKARFEVSQDLGDTPFEVYELGTDGYFTSEDPIAQGTVDAKAGVWNEVTLNKPVDIKEGYSYLLAYTYQQVYGEYPLSSDGKVNPGGEDANGYGSMIYGDMGEGEAWYATATGYGNLMIQAIVEGGNFLAEDITLSDLTATKMLKKGSQLDYSFSIKNNGESAISSYTLKVAIDGNEIETLTTPIALTNSYQTVNGTLTVPSDLTSDQHKLTVTVTSINGNTPTEGTNDDEVETTIVCYTQDVPRQLNLVENMTSQQCVYCPYGHDVLEKLTEMRSDIAWVAVHSSGMGTDLFVTDESDAISDFQCNGYPSASFNRTYIDDASINESGTLAVSIGYNPNYTQMAAQMFSDIIDEQNAAMPSFATVDIATTLNGKDLNIKVSGDAVEDFKKYVGEDAVMTVYLLEDGLVGTQNSSSGYIKDYVHSNVLRDVVTNNVYGDAINWTSATTYQNEFNVTLDDDWDPANMRVVAFIGRPVTNKSTIDDVWVNNTNMVKLGETTGIESTTISNNANVKEIARYTLDGRKLTKPTKGINLVKMSDGKTIKVIVK